MEVSTLADNLALWILMLRDHDFDKWFQSQMFLSSAFCVSQVSEQQLNDAIAQAVENSKLRKDKSQWSIDGDTLFIFTTFSASLSHIFFTLISWPVIAQL